MKLWSDSFDDDAPIPGEFAFAVPHPDQHVELSDNRNPHLAWSGLPMGTESLVLICHDTDAPTEPDDVNQEGRTVPLELPRADFFHWVLVDLPPEPAEIAAGEFSEGVTPGGKSSIEGPRGTRQGRNDYTQWFEGDPEMEGVYFGYDGPGPPWNDERVHRYHFTLYALDVERCPVENEFDAPTVLDVMETYVIGQTHITGTYSLNPDVRG